MTKTTAIGLFGLIAVSAGALLSTGAHSAPSSRPPLPVGYYDAQRVYGGSREAKAGMDGVEAKVKDQLAAAQKAGAEYQDAEKTKLAADVIAARRASAEAAGERYKKADADARTAVAADIDKRIAEAVTRIAAARGMSIVFAVPGKMPYAAPECDLTPDIVVAVDAGGPVK